MQVTIVGTGYVGLVTGAALAKTGNTVTCLDIDPGKVALLRQGTSPFYEPGLSELLTQNIEAGRLHFTDDRAAAYADAEVIFICVGTPTGDDERCDLTAVLAVADDIAANMPGHDPVVVVKSTVPVGTTKRIAERISGGTTQPFHIANNPEFLREGNALDDFMRPDRIVCGTDSREAETRLRAVYEPFTSQGHPLLVFDIPSSEMVKYASNAMLACKISFVNEIATLCERLGADINLVRAGMGTDHRIGTEFLAPGIGYGGSCFPKDTLAVIEMGEDTQSPCLINQAVHAINQRQRQRFLKRIIDHFDGDIRNKQVAVWGLAFKPQTDDVRAAPSIDILRGLLDGGAAVTAYDPEAAANFTAEVPQVRTATDRYSAVEGADVLIICTEWDEFRAPDFAKVRSLMASPVMFDGRNMYRPCEVAKAGFTYHSIGRPTAKACQTSPA